MGLHRWPARSPPCPVGPVLGAADGTGPVPCTFTSTHVLLTDARPREGLKDRGPEKLCGCLATNHHEPSADVTVRALGVITEELSPESPAACRCHQDIPQGAEPG